MKPIDPAKPVPPPVTAMWDERGVRFDRDERNPDGRRYDILCPANERWDGLKELGPCYARTERVHCPYKETVGLCRSSKDGSVADRHNDIVRDSFSLVPMDRLSLPSTVVLDPILKTDGLDDVKADLLAAIEKTYHGYGRQ